MYVCIFLKTFLTVHPQNFFVEICLAVFRLPLFCNASVGCMLRPLMKVKCACVPSRSAEDTGVKGTFEMDPRREVCFVYYIKPSVCHAAFAKQ